MTEIVAINAAVLKATEFPVGPHWDASQIETECREGVGRVQVGEDRKILAFVLFRNLYQVWEVGFLATRPEMRRRGLMRGLLEHLISELPANYALWLEVHEKNLGARRLYEDLGFKKVGERPRYYADGGCAWLYNYG